MTPLLSLTVVRVLGLLSEIVDAMSFAASVAYVVGASSAKLVSLFDTSVALAAPIVINKRSKKTKHPFILLFINIIHIKKFFIMIKVLMIKNMKKINRF